MNKTVILIHEIYGITSNLLKLKKKLINKKFNVILPSLYGNQYCEDNEATSYNRFYNEVGIETGFSIVNSIIGENINSEIYLIGFSVGATIAWQFATDKRVSSIIGIYGSKIRNYLNIKPIVQCYLYFYNEISFDIKNMIEVLKTKENVEVKEIDGEHGFYNSHDEKNRILIDKIDNDIFRIIGC